MRLVVEPEPDLDILSEDMELVMETREDGIPQVFLAEGRAVPDRHLVLGLIQSVVVAVEDRDGESVLTADPLKVVLENEQGQRELAPELVVFRTISGRFGALARGDWREARRRARLALRYFTGTIRLDVP
jgi:hypothetical protein